MTLYFLVYPPEPDEKDRDEIESEEDDDEEDEEESSDDDSAAWSGASRSATSHLEPRSM